MKEYRVIKKVPKSCADHERLRHEALILKDLRSPGFPLVYDIEEDSDFSYLIEEHIRGESLYSLVKSQGYLSKTKTIHYGIQICYLVDYLHSAGNIPILHLDLHPKNLIVCNGSIKLVDFDRAADLNEANLTLLRYGTKECSAPEQYTEELLDERTDIYAIGVILMFMATGNYELNKIATDEYFDLQLLKVIHTCICKDKKERFQSALQVREELEALEKRQSDALNMQLSSLNIAFLGSEEKVGTTHLAIGLTAFLGKAGLQAVYEECNRTNDVNIMSCEMKRKTDLFGNIDMGNWLLRSRSGSTIEKYETVCEICVKDYGHDFKGVCRAEKTDLLILVCGSRPWEQKVSRDAIKKIEELPCKKYIVFNLCSGLRGIGFMKETDRKNCFPGPYFPDPFKPDQKAEILFERLLKTENIKEGVQIRQKLKKVLTRILQIGK